MQMKSAPSPHHSAGFTLIELLIVCTVTGFIVIAATGIMVSFTKIKYSADVQVQLKTEATFAANQIDLLIRNSSGIPDLCISEYNSDTYGTVKYCSGDYQQDFSRSSAYSSSCNINDPDLDFEACWGKSTSQCIYEPTNKNSSAPKDIFYTYIDGNNEPYSSYTEKFLNPQATGTPLYQKSYRWSMSGGNPTAFKASKNYLIVQAKRQEPAISPPNTFPSSTFYNVSPTNPNAGKTCIYDDRQGPVPCQDTQTVYYNKVINIQQSIAGGTTGQLAINEFKVGEKLYNGNVRNIDTGDATTLFKTVMNDITKKPMFRDANSSLITSLYLTSQSVIVEDLSFECTLRNYGLPTQAAAIKYTITVAIKKESNNSYYEDMRQEENASGQYLKLSERPSYESLSITRLVNVRNSNQPFRYSQHAN